MSQRHRGAAGIEDEPPAPGLEAGALIPQRQKLGNPFSPCLVPPYLICPRTPQCSKARQKTTWSRRPCLVPDVPRRPLRRYRGSSCHCQLWATSRDGDHLFQGPLTGPSCHDRLTEAGSYLRDQTQDTAHLRPGQVPPAPAPSSQSTALLPSLQTCLFFLPDYAKLTQAPTASGPARQPASQSEGAPGCLDTPSPLAGLGFSPHAPALRSQ